MYQSRVQAVGALTKQEKPNKTLKEYRIRWGGDSVGKTPDAPRRRAVDRGPGTIAYGDLIRRFFFEILFSIFFIWTHDVRKRKGAFALALSTICFVAFIVCLLECALESTNGIFVRIGQDSVGETDVIVLSSLQRVREKGIAGLFVNTTRLAEAVSGNPDVLGVTPRWILRGRVDRRAMFDEALNFSSGTSGSAQDAASIEVYCIIADFVTEASLGLGRMFEGRIIGETEAHVSASVVNLLGLTPQHGDVLFTQLDIASLLPQMPSFEFDATIDLQNTNISSTLLSILGLLGLNQTLPDTPQTIRVSSTDLEGLMSNGHLPLALINSISSASGKYPSALGNVVLMDIRVLSRLFDPREFALTSVMMLRDSRAIYSLSSEERRREWIRVSDSLFRNLDVRYDVLRYPVFDSLKSLDMMYVMLCIEPKLTQSSRFMLDNVLITVVIVLTGLGAALLSSVLAREYDERVFSLGLLRTFGMLQPSIVSKSIVYSILFVSIPAVLGAVLLGGAGSFILDYVFYRLLGFRSYSPTFLSTRAVLLTLFVAVALPLVANLLPLGRVLSRSLVDALNVAKKFVDDAPKVAIRRLEKIGIKPWLVALSSVMIVSGITVYYVLPFMMIMGKMQEFFITLQLIFLAMLLSACVVCVLILPLLSRCILWVVIRTPAAIVHVCSCGRRRGDVRISGLVQKNLHSHRHSNVRAFLMFAFCTTLLVFSGVNLDMLANTVQGNLEMIIGADVRLRANWGQELPRKRLSEFLDDMQTRGVIDSYSFVSGSIAQPESSAGRAVVSNLGGWPGAGQHLVAISQNYLETTYSDKYYFVDSVNRGVSPRKTRSGRPDLVDSLYTQRGLPELGGAPKDYIPSTILSGTRWASEEKDEEDLVNFDPSEKYVGSFDVAGGLALKEGVGIDANSGWLVKFGFKSACFGFPRVVEGNWSCSHTFMARPHGIFSKMPGFYMTSRRSYYIIMSFEDYRRIVTTIEDVKCEMKSSTCPFHPDVPIMSTLIRLSEQTKADESGLARVAFVNELSTQTDTETSYIHDVQDLLESTETGIIAFDTVFYVVGSIAMAFCTIMLGVTFSANVFRDAFPIAVLRSIGFRSALLIRGYIYEGVTIVLSAFLCGVILGCCSGILLVGQFNLFIEMPFRFPTDNWLPLAGVLFIVMIVCAVLGSYFPSRRLRKTEIAHALRGLE